ARSAEGMHATIAVKGHPGNGRGGAARGECDVAGDGPARAEGAAERWRHRVGAHRKAMQATPAVEDVAAGAIAEQHQALGDVPKRPIAPAADRGRAAKRM